MNKLKSLLILILVLFSIRVLAQQPPQLTSNWTGINVYDYTHDPWDIGSGFKVPIGATQVGFTFTLPSHTKSAALVVDASGVIRRTLWKNRNYPAGVEFGEIWNGLDDNGVAVPSSSGPFTITVQTNSVNYVWRGLIGFVGNPFSQSSWNLSAESFPYDMASIGTQGYLALDLSEQAFQAESFPLATPTTGVQALNTVLFNGADFEYAATDGNLLYFSARPISGNGGVFAFDQNGYFHSFSKGSLLPSGSNPTNADSDPTFTQKASPQVADMVVAGTSVITGIAVCPNSQVLATAHGARLTIASLDTVFTWDKTTGVSTGSITVPNPHRMTCDQSGNIWVISGTGISGDVLYEIPSGSSTAAPSTISGLSNPVALSVSPTTGDLFIGDGGTNQQVFEYNSSQALVRTLGAPGGYGSGITCNSIYSPYKLHLDYSGVAGTLPDKFVSVDANGDLWVSDTDSGMIRHYSLVSGVWTYVNRIMFQADNHFAGLMTNAPTRAFTGGSGSDLVEVDLATNADGTMLPIQNTDPDPNLGGNGSWTVTNNYAPCIETSPNWVQANGVPSLIDAWHSPTSSAAMLLVSGTSGIPTFGPRIVLNSNGTITYEAKPGGFDYTSQLLPDPVGNAYAINNTTRLIRFTSTSTDPFGLPIIPSSSTTLVSTAAVNPSLGQASGVVTNGGLTTRGIYPFYQTSVNLTVNAGLTAFHLGLLSVPQTEFVGQVFPQKNIGTNDFQGSFPAQNIISGGQEGGTSYTIGSHILMMYDGNSFPGSCHFFDFTDNGALVGEYGYAVGLMSSSFNGNPNAVPDTRQRHNKIPAYCGDVGAFKPVQVNSNLIRQVNGDESYMLGTAVFELQNLNSVQTISATGTFGSTVNLH
jgi:hypothetical protein